MAKKPAAPKAKATAKSPKAMRIAKLRKLIAGDEALMKRLAEQEGRAKARLERRRAELAELKGGSGESKPKIVLGEPTPPEKEGSALVRLLNRKIF